ncbi:MAG TPA: glycosyltransferase family 2 protein [Actinomycetota bacterium]|nr:glycosyltransferase family 2 protein [Actinomycetota bacterium]
MTELAAADLDVVVVNYNAGAYLVRCLESVFGSAGDVSVAVAVVDNASRDRSARAAAERFPQIHVIENPDNRGLSAALNQGIRATASPFVLLLNPDAEITGGTLERLLKVARDHPRAGAVGPLIRNPDGSVYLSGRRFPTVGQAVGHALLGPLWPGNPFSRAYRIDDWDRTTEREVDWVSLACMLVPRAAFEDVGVFDEGFFLYAEELDFCTRLANAGWSVVFTPELEVTHEGGVSTGRSRRMTLEHSRGIYRYYAKHRSPGWRKALLPVAWLVLRLRAVLASLRGRQ